MLPFEKYSVKSSFDDWSEDNWLRFGSGIGNNLAWSGCNKVLDGRRCLFVGDVVSTNVCIDDFLFKHGRYGIVFGDGDAWLDSMPESRAFVLTAESRRSLSMLSTHSSICVPKTKLLPSALLRGESYIFSEYHLLFTLVR